MKIEDLPYVLIVALMCLTNLGFMALTGLNWVNTIAAVVISFLLGGMTHGKYENRNKIDRP